MSKFLDIRKKYDSFDWEYYSSNYFEDDRKKYSLNKEDCWWHYLTIGKEKNYLYFDIKDSDIRNIKCSDFDWEEYAENYEIDQSIYPTKYHLWWHYVNIGEPNEYIFFSKKRKYDLDKQKNNFDKKFYLQKYKYLQVPEDKLWWHYLNFGKSMGFKYFDKVDSINSSLKKSHSLYERNNYFKLYNCNILLFFPTLSIYSSSLDYDHVMFNLSQSLINLQSNLNIYCVKFDFMIKQLVLLEDHEINKLFNNNVISLEFKNKMLMEKNSLFFDKIKFNENNIFLTTFNFFPTEINKLPKLGETISSYKKVGIYDFMQYLNSNNDDSNLNKITINFISKFDVLFTSSINNKEKLQSLLKKHTFAKPEMIINEVIPLHYNYNKQISNVEIGNNFILIIGNLRENKDIYYVISQCKKFSLKHPSVQFYLLNHKINKESLFSQKIKYFINTNFTLIDYDNLTGYINLIEKAKFIIVLKLDSFYINDVRIASSLGKNIITNTNNSNFEDGLDIKNLIKCNFENDDLNMCISKFYENETIDNNLSTSLKTWAAYSGELIGILKNKKIIRVFKNKENKSDNNTLFIFIDKNVVYSKFQQILFNSLIDFSNKNSNLKMYFITWIKNQFVLVNQQMIKNLDYDYSLLDITNDDLISHLKNGIVFFSENYYENNIFISNFLIENNIKSIYYFQYNDPFLANSSKDCFFYLNLLNSYKLILNNFTCSTITNQIEALPGSFGLPVIDIIDLPYTNYKELRSYEKKSIKNRITIGMYNPIGYKHILQFLDQISYHNYSLLEIYIVGENKLLDQYPNKYNNVNWLNINTTSFPNFIKQINYMYIENVNLDNELLRRDCLWFNCPVIWNDVVCLKNQNINGCIMYDLNNKDSIQYIFDDKRYLDKQNEIVCIQMDTWNNYIPLLVDKIINL
mgnify:CR=1 FL=1